MLTTIIATTWIIGECTKTASLPAGESKEFKVAVAGTGATQAKVVFSRVIMADGTTQVPKQ